MATPKVYRLVDRVEGKVYVGSTTKPLAIREYAHRGNYNRYVKTGGVKGYGSAFEVIKNGDWYIELLEELPADATRGELLLRERYYAEHAENAVNSNVPARTPAQYYEDNHDAILERQRKNYHMIKERKREYYQANKEKRIAYAKNRYAAIRETVLAKETCACGVTYCAQTMRKHKKTCASHLGVGGDSVVL